MSDFIGDGRCVTHHQACECRERHFKELEIRLSTYERKETKLLERFGVDEGDKVDREDLKAMINYLLGENVKVVGDAFCSGFEYGVKYGYEEIIPDTPIEEWPSSLFAADAYEVWKKGKEGE